MGGECSIPRRFNTDWKNWIYLFDVLHLSYAQFILMNDISKSCFDESGGGYSIQKLSKCLGLQDHAFLQKAAQKFSSLAGVAKSSCLPDFPHLVIFLWSICTLSPTTIMSFSFSIYDEDQRGDLPLDSLQNFIRNIHAAVGSRINEEKIVESTNNLIRVNIAEFELFLLQNTGILDSLVETLWRFQQRTGGSAVWNTIARQRISYVPGSSVNILEFKAKHLYRSLLYPRPIYQRSSPQSLLGILYRQRKPYHSHARKYSGNISSYKSKSHDQPQYRQSNQLDPPDKEESNSIPRHLFSISSNKIYPDNGESEYFAYDSDDSSEIPPLKPMYTMNTFRASSDRLNSNRGDVTKIPVVSLPE